MQRFHDVILVDKSAARGEPRVSSAGTVVHGDGAQRPQKLERKSAEGLAYAALRATTDGLTYGSSWWRIR